MSERLHHLTLSTCRREPLARDRETRRVVLRTLVRVAGPEAILFCLVDDHLHLVVAGDHQSTGARASGLTRALGAAGVPPNNGFHIRPVEGRGHLEWLVGYLLTQSTKHGLADPPALYEGSCFQDLVGARLLGGFERSALWRWLPRWRTARLYRVVGVPHPCADPELSTASLDRILAAARVALCTSLLGRSAEAVRARRAVAGLASQAGFRTTELARALGCTQRAVQKLCCRPDEPAQRAVRRRLALEQAVLCVDSDGALRQCSPR